MTQPPASRISFTKLVLIPRVTEQHHSSLLTWQNIVREAPATWLLGVCDCLYLVNVNFLLTHAALFLGQHAHLPTNFTSSAIYFNSYRNCGGGVIEVTTAIHNNALPGGDKFVYNNVPWGGVRTSVLQDVVIGNAQSNGNQQDPLKGFGDNSFIPNLDETGGYTAFAEDLPSIEGFKMPCADEATGQAADCEAMSAKPVSLSLPGKRFTMPRGVELKTPAAPDVIPCGDGSGKIAPCTQSNTSKVNLKIVSICRESPRHTKKWGKFTVRCKIEPTALVNVGCHRGCSFRFTNPSTGSSITATDKAVLHWAWKGKFFFFWPDATEGEVQQVFPPGSDIQATYLHEPLPCVESPGHTKAWGRYTVRCQIEPTTVNTDPDFSSIVLKNPDTSGTVEASKGILHYSHAQKNFYLWPDVSAEAVSKVFPWGSSIVPSYEDSVDRCRESPGHTLNLGVYTVVCTIEPTAILKTGYYGNLVMTNPDTGSKIPLKGVLHWAWNGNSFYFYPDATAGEVNEAFPSGSKFEFEKSGKPVEENLALALVHGTHGKSDFDRAKPRIRFGGASGIRRDYTVFTVNAISNIMPGDTYVQKQFFISDKFTEIDARARSLSPQTTRDLYTRATTPQGRDVLLYTVPGQTDVFSASIGSLSCASATTVCRGSTTPKQEYRAYFAIECGEERYVGSDPYYFAPKSTPIQSWKCESNELTPTWKLLGYFPPGECDEISNLTYRLNLC